MTKKQAAGSSGKVKTYLNDEEKLRVDSKIDEMKQKRTGKTQQLDINVNESPQLNLHHALKEVIAVINMHRLAPIEIDVIRANLNDMAIGLRLNSFGNQFYKALMEKINPAPKEKPDPDAGKVRVKPGDKIKEAK